MPLSEHEQRVLEQIERALYADDPKFAATVRGIDPQILRRRRFLRAALVGGAGVVMLPVGLYLSQYEITFAGLFLILLASLYAAVGWRQAHERATPQVVVRTAPGTAAGGSLTVRPSSRRERPARPKRAFLERMEDRWNRRREELGGGRDSNE